MKNWTLNLIAYSTFLSASLYSLPAHSASFNCNKASSTVEHLICTNPELSKLDESLALQYKAEREDAKDNKYDYSDEIRAKQIQWLTFQRNTCTDESCLLREYQERLGCDKEHDGHCGNEHGRSDIVDNKAFGTFAESIRITFYNPEAPNNEDVSNFTNEISIHKVEQLPYLAVIDSTLIFDRGHTCNIGEVLATWAQNHWVLKDTYDGKNLELRFYPATHNGKTKLLVRDIDDHYRESACGMRGYFDGLVFERQ
ncbi:lysozyme inhibitor LprI family protein [Psychrobacter sp.]|uniref:lysozyme inhibitor LprI family protein n=1 Tax=Psychrobacter sp. TaxID=56811 RepID=UPI0025DD7761|nr:lysozyme inhibitor LprI family protein [Psychrobacter sp.]